MKATKLIPHPLQPKNRRTELQQSKNSSLSFTLTKKLALWMMIIISRLALSASNDNHLDVPIYVDGEIKTLKALAQGRPSLLVFWAVDCHFCKIEVPSLNKLEKELGDSMLILAINTDQEFDALLRIPEYIEQYKLTSKVLKDPRGLISAHFGVPGTPTIVALDEKGALLTKTHRDINKLVPALKSLIDNNSISKDRAKTHTITNKEQFAIHAPIPRTLRL